MDFQNSEVPFTPYFFKFPLKFHKLVLALILCIIYYVFFHLAVEKHDPVVAELNIINVAQLSAYYKVEYIGGEYQVMYGVFLKQIHHNTPIHCLPLWCVNFMSNKKLFNCILIRVRPINRYNRWCIDLNYISVHRLIFLSVDYNRNSHVRATMP